MSAEMFIGQQADMGRIEALTTPSAEAPTPIGPSYGEVGINSLGAVVAETRNGNTANTDGDGEGWHTPSPESLTAEN